MPGGRRGMKFQPARGIVGQAEGLHQTQIAIDLVRVVGWWLYPVGQNSPAELT